MRLRVNHVIITDNITLKIERLRSASIRKIIQEFLWKLFERFRSLNETHREHREFVNLLFLFSFLSNGCRGSFLEGKAAEESSKSLNSILFRNYKLVKLYLQSPYTPSCTGTTKPPPIWRVAANIPNKQSWRADKRWSSSLEVGRGANNFSP